MRLLRNCRLFMALVLVLTLVLTNAKQEARAQAKGWGRPPADTVKLPFETLNVEADAQDNLIQYSWLTTAHEDKGRFVVQRSRDSLVWHSVGLIDSKAGETAPYFYKTRVNAAYQYIRLAYQNAAGQLAPVHTKKLSFRCVNVQLRASLNRRTRSLRLRYQLDQPKELLLRVFDQIGQEVHTQIVPSRQAGQYQIEIDFADFKRGVYLLVITQADADLDVADYRIEY